MNERKDESLPFNIHVVTSPPAYEAREAGKY